VRKATDFEYRYQTLIHLFIVTIAFLTYLIDRDDIVWALVKGQPYPQLLERLLFGVAAVLIGGSAAIRTWARAYPEDSSGGGLTRRDGPYRYIRYPEQLGNLLFSIGLGFFAPLLGLVILVTGEAIVSLRLVRRERALRSAGTPEPADSNSTQLLPSYRRPAPNNFAPTWKKAFRQESAKWGLFLTMIVFILLLRDRVAEVLAGLSFLVWVLLNYRSFQALFPR
jgi:protein-S-isoprenylcysteine O-methyltransferase Ste14